MNENEHGQTCPFGVFLFFVFLFVSNALAPPDRKCNLFALALCMTLTFLCSFPLHVAFLSFPSPLYTHTHTPLTSTKSSSSIPSPSGVSFSPTTAPSKSSLALGALSSARTLMYRRWGVWGGWVGRLTRSDGGGGGGRGAIQAEAWGLDRGVGLYPAPTHQQQSKGEEEGGIKDAHEPPTTHHNPPTHASRTSNVSVGRILTFCTCLPPSHRSFSWMASPPSPPPPPPPPAAAAASLAAASASRLALASLSFRA